MNGDAAEEVVRMALNTADISIRLVGAGAKNLAALLVAWAKKEKTHVGKTSLELSQVLGISDTQLSYVTNAEIGTGLLVCGGSIVPFENRFPENTMLYKLMTTKPMESMVC